MAVRLNNFCLLSLSCLKGNEVLTDVKFNLICTHKQAVQLSLIHHLKEHSYFFTSNY